MDMKRRQEKSVIDHQSKMYNLGLRALYTVLGVRARYES